MLKVALVGNCQVTALGRLFNRSRSLEVTAIADVNAIESDSFIDSVFRINSKNNIEYLISQPISSSFDDISGEKLRNLYRDNFISHTNLYFTGLHPDISYFGVFGKRTMSPLGDYHSKIILTCFLKDLSIEECLSKFNGKTYEMLGYMSAFLSSSEELIRRDADNVVKFSDRFLDLTRQQLTMLSVNHPTVATLTALGQDIAAHLGLKTPELTPDIWTTPFGDGPIWPIYPEIGEYLQLSYQTPMVFYPATSAGIRPLTLPEFVAQSYVCYDAQDPENMKLTGLGQQLLALAI